MIIKNIKLKNFQCYDEYYAPMSNLTLIQGANGSGKTTLGVDALLFGLYGYTKKTLKDLPTKGKDKCSVTIECSLKGEHYTISRHYPSFIEIIYEGKKLEFATTSEAQKYLSDLVGDINYFKRFRMIDNEVGINFLEEGPQTLKKILFSVSDELFNKIKDNLNTVKREREIYNKDKAVVHKHYPSEKRLKILNNGINALRNEESKYSKEINLKQQEARKISSEVSSIETKKRTKIMNLEDLEINEECYACHRGVEEDKAKIMIKELNDSINLFSKKIQEKDKTLKTVLSNIETIEKQRNQFSPRINRLSNLKLKLETRIKQKDYKYTTKDVEVAKRAILEVDSLSTKCLVRSIKILEPIINSVLNKINFKVDFDINNKGKLSIDLYKENIKYNYKDLSAGQKLLLQVAFKIALLLERNETGVIIADEGFSSLDRNNLLHVLNIFEQYPFQLIMVLHNFNDVPNNIKVINLENKTIYENTIN